MLSELGYLEELARHTTLRREEGGEAATQSTSQPCVHKGNSLLSGSGEHTWQGSHRWPDLSLRTPRLLSTTIVLFGVIGKCRYR